MREAIDSALAQSYPRVEVIVVNDGSRDEGATDAIARLYGSRIRYFTKTNGGCGSALNRGIAEMHGEYFSWLSHDDVYLPDKVAHQVDILSRLANPRTIVYGGYEVIDSASHVLATVRPDSVLPVDRLNIPLLPLLRGLIHGCSMLIPAQLFQEVGVFDEARPTTQDYALWFQFLRVAPIHYDPKILIRSRVHPEQDSNRLGVRHIQECNELWSGFLLALTSREMVEMAGSPYRFLRDTERFLGTTTPYSEAGKLAGDLAEQALADYCVSVVVNATANIGDIHAAIQSVCLQSHGNIEILVVCEAAQVLTEICPVDARIRFVSVDQVGAANAINAAVRVATGCYVALLDVRDTFAPNKVRSQLTYMEERGVAFCHTAFEYTELPEGEPFMKRANNFSGVVFPEIIATCPIEFSTVMGTTELFRSNPAKSETRLGWDWCLWIELARTCEFGFVEQQLSRVGNHSPSEIALATSAASRRADVLAYVLQDPVLAKYGARQKYLAKTLIRLLSDTAGPPINLRPRLGIQASVPSGFERLLAYARERGARATVRRCIELVKVELARRYSG